MTFSIARERYTPLLKSARNFDGIVSRCLASRVCSKVPVKAKAHGLSEREARRGQSIRGGGVGGAPPPRNGFAQGKVPHNAPLCNTEPARCPTRLSRSQQSGRFAGLLRLEGFGRRCTRRCNRAICRPRCVSGAGCAPRVGRGG